MEDCCKYAHAVFSSSLILDLSRMVLTFVIAKFHFTGMIHMDLNILLLSQPFQHDNFVLVHSTGRLTSKKPEINYFSIIFQN